jgi:TatA/E family protein of Tat protein translocase
MTTGGTELLVVLAIAVLLFGPKKLPELARTIGQAMGEYHKAQREFETEVRKTTTSIDREVTSATSLEPKAPATGQTARTGKPAPSSPSSGSETGMQTYKVKEIAKNLGIETDKKTDSQLLREISMKTKKKEG